MRKIDIIRINMGLEQYRWLRINGQGRSVVGPLNPAKAEPQGGQHLEFMTAAAPSRAVMSGFRPREAEAKVRNPKRPLPVKGEFGSFTLDIGAEERTVFVPMLIAGDREDGTYVKITVEKNADVRLFLVTAETESPIYLDIVQEENSSLHFSIVKNPGFTSWQLLSYRVRVAANARFTGESINLESSAYQVGQIFLEGEGASADTMSAMYVDPFEEIRIDTSIEHKVGHTDAHMYHHGVIAPQAYGTFAGRGYVDKGAAGSNAFQESRFLMLDESSKADAYPVLVIDESDIKAGHAYTSGGLDQDQLYYLQSRGLDEDSARHLVTAGFLQPVIDRLAVEKESPAAAAADYLLKVLREKVNT